MKRFYLFIIALILTSGTFAGELFIRVTRPGLHYATVSNQTIYNATNIFRFFDLPGGGNSVNIIDQQSGTPIFTSFIQVQSNQRIVCEVDANGNLIVLQQINMHFLNWYTSTPVNNQQSTIAPSHPGSGQTIVAVADPYFQHFIESLKNESFDSNRLQMIDNYLANTMVAASQINEMAKTFDFDSNRLTFAKNAYKKCYDPQNYFLLQNTFQFSSNYQTLTKWISEQ